MSLADDLKADRPPAVRCWFSTLELDSDDLAALEWAMAQPVAVKGHVEIAEKLAEHGVTTSTGSSISAKQIENHRRSRCRCPR